VLLLLHHFHRLRFAQIYSVAPVMFVDIPRVPPGRGVPEQLKQVAELSVRHGVAPGGEVDEGRHESLRVDRHPKGAVLEDESACAALDAHGTGRGDLARRQRRHTRDGKR